MANQSRLSNNKFERPGAVRCVSTSKGSRRSNPESQERCSPNPSRCLCVQSTEDCVSGVSALWDGSIPVLTLRESPARLVRSGRKSARSTTCAFGEYDLTVEGDVLLGSPSADAARVRWLIESVVTAADRLEAVLLEIDHDPTAFKDGLEREAEFER